LAVECSVLEHAARRGDSPPLHLHVNEDEIFHILEGDFRFQIGTEERNGQAGDTVLAPKGIPHTYRVESNTGRWLTVTDEPVRVTDSCLESSASTRSSSDSAEEISDPVGRIRVSMHFPMEEV
jgi:mannose-6-phosphate isomerase-like protein (cupin superfamily)